MRSNKPPHKSPCLIQVALFTPLTQNFDYLCPPQYVDKLQVGMRVLVPFGRRQLLGIVVNFIDTSPWAEVKEVLDVFDDVPCLSPDLMRLLQWLSAYYHAPLGMVFETALPQAVRKLKPLVYPKTRQAKHKKNSTPFKTLNPEQSLATQQILAALASFQVFLLDGVTGSGKTEVYLHITKAVLERQQQVLIIVPEIGLTPQLLGRFYERFTQNIALVHSGVSEQQRLKAWLDARSNQAAIIIGTRSAAFTPIQNLGLIIIDEEHDLSLKQQEGVRYSARDTLIKRASLGSCPIVLGSATPSLESIANAQAARYQWLRLSERASGAKLPRVVIQDIKQQKLSSGLSDAAIGAIRATLEQNHQVLLFLNRRGFAPVLMCYSCGWLAQCHQCDAKLTLHMGQNVLLCHHCDTKKPIPQACPECQAPALKPVGHGTERLEECLQELFPTTPATRIDRDSMRGKNTFAQTIDLIHQSDAHILIGTQMLAKGHHFPKVMLAVIIEADSALYSTDFRSIERLGQLLTQISGRAGRAGPQGQVLLQTCHPQHPDLQKWLRCAYAEFAASLLIERRLLSLPPFSFQALLRAEARQSHQALAFLAQAHQACPTPSSSLSLEGPVRAPMARRVGFHRAQLLVQALERRELHNALKSIVKLLQSVKVSADLRWSIDVDPQEMF